MTTDELRAKFENWWLRNGDPFDLHKVAAWELWQAAHASRDAEIEALQDALFQISVRLKADREPDMDDMSWHTDMMARAQHLTNVEAEVGELREDAERYRWLRLKCTDELCVRKGVALVTGAALNAALDAAMREESK